MRTNLTSSKAVEPRTTSRFDVISADTTGLTLLDCTSHDNFGRHCHVEYGIGLMRDGGQISASGRGEVEAGPGNLITVNPGEVHDGRALGGRSRRWHMVYFPVGIADNFIRDHTHGATNNYEWTRPVFQDAASRNLVRALICQLAVPHPDRHAIDETLCEVLANAPHRNGRRHDVAKPSTRFMRIAEQLRDQSASPPGLTELGREHGLSPFAVIRAMRSLTGLTPHQIVIQRRLQIARGLILGGTPIAEAAVEAGFADQSHFNRHFTRSYGFTPGRLAKALARRNFVQDAG